MTDDWRVDPRARVLVMLCGEKCRIDRHGVSRGTILREGTFRQPTIAKVPSPCEKHIKI